MHFHYMTYITRPRTIFVDPYFVIMTIFVFLPPNFPPWDGGS